MWWVLGASAVAVIVLVFVGREILNSNTVRQFLPLSVSIDNQSDAAIVSVEVGLESNSSSAAAQVNKRDLIIKSGTSATIKPDLKLSGESSVYLLFTDENGRSIKETVCSYTESLSGYSSVVIYNDTVKVDERCS
ncbi:hypothetical protein PCURB6_37660 [Paenibacillus curdlanolyticus]|nr:hypothetical protein PCURB6_37660 [Paenibacillus curdlanolyticus]